MNPAYNPNSKVLRLVKKISFLENKQFCSQFTNDIDNSTAQQ